MNSLIGILVDGSSSMQGYEKSTLAGLNKFIEYQQLRQDDCSLYLASFATHKGYYAVHRQFVSMFDARFMERDEYQPSGGTPLYASSHKLIDDMDAHISTLPENERPPLVTVIIQSDGGDTQGGNGPQSLERLHRKMIEHQAKNWQFVYLGLRYMHVNRQNNLPKEPELSQPMGLPWDAAIWYNAKTTDVTFEALAKNVLESSVTGRIKPVIL